MSASKRTRRWILFVELPLFLLVAGAVAAEIDLWIHPRAGDTYDPQIHYRDSSGQLYYHAENDIEAGLERVIVNGGQKRTVTFGIGREMAAMIERDGATLRPVFLWDSDEDDAIDRSLRGRLENGVAVFDDPQLADIAMRKTHWQIGLKYVGGRPEYNGRYVASVDSREARITYQGAAALPDVGAGSFAPGLVVFKHEEGTPFDLAGFIDQPGRYLEYFKPLTREEDEDDWTVKGDRGRLITHLDRENLFFVRTEEGFHLDVEWGDVPLEDFFSDYLEAPRNADGCYSSLDSELESYDGAAVDVPQTIYYCPDRDVALFDAKPGYEIGLKVTTSPEVHEYTEAGSTTMSNFRLYVRQLNPRRATSRSTGTVTGNVKASYRDAGADVQDFARNLTTGSEVENIHTGERTYRASPITAVPRFLIKLATLAPIAALGELFDGASSAVYAGANAASAASNSVVNPALQMTVGLASPTAADYTNDTIGFFAQGMTQNFPGGERSQDAVSPVAAWRHDRAFAPAAYTRTDTQLNFDRTFVLIDSLLLAQIDTSDSTGDGGGQGDGGGDGMGPPGNGGPNGPPPPNGGPPHMRPPKMKPPKMKPPKHPKMPKMKHFKKKFFKKHFKHKKKFDLDDDVKEFVHIKKHFKHKEFGDDGFKQFIDVKKHFKSHKNFDFTKVMVKIKTWCGF